MTIELGKPNGWEQLPPGDYAIIELFGHTTLLGRFSEIERFGTKMLALEPLFNGKLLDPIYHGGAAIYRLSPCSRQVAWERQHTDAWQFPPSIRAVLPPELLPAPAPDPFAFEPPGDDSDDGPVDDGLDEVAAQQTGTM